jgi:hypothetical protein
LLCRLSHTQQNAFARTKSSAVVRLTRTSGGPCVQSYLTMSLTGSSSTWSTFLSDLPTSERCTNIPGEDLFHREFKQACTKRRERDPERLLARFLRYHDHIIAFVSTLDESTGLDVSNCLSSVFWSKAFETFEVSCSGDTAMDLLSKVTLIRKHWRPGRKTSWSEIIYQDSATLSQLSVLSSRYFQTTR